MMTLHTCVFGQIVVYTQAQDRATSPQLWQEANRSLYLVQYHLLCCQPEERNWHLLCYSDPILNTKYIIYSSRNTYIFGH